MYNKFNEKQSKLQYNSDVFKKVLGDKSAEEEIKDLFKETMGIEVKDVTIIRDKALENPKMLDHVANAYLIITFKDDTKKIIQLKVNPNV